MVDVIAAQMVMAKADPNEQRLYHTNICKFAASKTPEFLSAGVPSLAQMTVDKEQALKSAAEASGKSEEELRGCTAVDGKFSVLAAGTVATNILSLLPVEMRGLLLGELFDFLILNAGIPPESQKAVLVNTLMKLGTQEVEIIKVSATVAN